MAIQAYNLFTSGSTTYGARLQKKVQGNLLKGFQTRCEEFGWVKNLKEFDLNFSAREVTTPIDITNQPQGAFIPEGGYESSPITAAPQELTFTWANYNARFSLTNTAQYIDQKNRQVQIVRQLKYQAMKQAEGMANRVGTAFYGYSTGYLAQTSTNAAQSSGTYTLINAFGDATTNVDTAAYLAGLFQIGDRVALIRSAALVTNAIGEITAKSAANGTIDITWAGSVDSDANDYVVLANSVENATIAGTDYNKAPVGLLEMTHTASVHGLSGSTYPNWSPALKDSSAGDQFG